LIRAVSILTKLKIMEPKKNPKYDVHRKSGMLFSFSLGCSLLIVITAFEWETKVSNDPIERNELTKTLDDTYYPQVTVVDPPAATAASKPRVMPVIDPNRIVASSNAHEPEIEVAVVQPDPNPNANGAVPEIRVEIDVEEADQIFLFPETHAEPRKGYENFYKQLRDNLKYPAKARRMNTQGRVYIQFVVDDKGELSNISVLKGIGDGCDEEAIRVLGLTKWNPGKQRGKPVKVRMVLPIIFSLN
jgi:periplasmic protein TonB